MKGSKNQKAAQDFVHHATSAEALENLASALGPLRQSSVKRVDPKVVPYLPTAPQNQKNAIDANVAFWADHSDDLNQKFAVSARDAARLKAGKPEPEAPARATDPVRDPT
ncbi:MULTISPECIES: hypothetical protein [unclassified Burkholderia]|uniref:hypothetical protein n=1 Tax=unclassified Burkholderia TaxID=2613784 RepID=UPI001E2FBADD|nr:MULTISPECIES: hypothetical protein [unclassified Burkholderia]UEP32680.1 hypothetical protein LMA01_35240 [Burkholderia sp. B21-007]UEP46261.1 hypothetical protein LMA02_31035 [Burkholderia sp. B21-005]